MSDWRLLLPALVVLLTGRAALADGSALEQAKAYFRAGAQAYAVGEYAAAVQAFEQANRLAPRPAVLFSIAQAERKQYFLDHKREHLTQAIALYRRYLETEPQAGRKVDAVGALSELEPLVAPESTKGEAEAPPPPPPTRVMVSSPASDAQVSLDGQTAVLSPLIREVAPGRHRVRVSAPGYLDADRSLVAVPGAFVTVDIPLAERPAELVVIAPAGAQLSIDGRVEGECPFPRPLELPAGQHLVTLTKRGLVGVSGEEVLVRGRTTVVRATMPRSPQRTASLLMLGASASALAAGGVFTYFTLSQESSARSFLEHRGNAPLAGDDLAQYNSARRDRDRLRTAAFISLGSGAGLAVASAFLFWLDGRMVTAPAGRDRGATGPKPRVVGAGPVLAPGFRGFGLNGEF
jgi:tetratricopeptide (TPR) repeat protein